MKYIQYENVYGMMILGSLFPGAPPAPHLQPAGQKDGIEKKRGGG
jgi:hypothetical protein